MVRFSPERQTTEQSGASPPSSAVSSSRCQRTFRMNQKYWVLKKVGIQLSWLNWGFLVIPVFSPIARMLFLILSGNSVISTLPMATSTATCTSTQSLFSHRPGQVSPISVAQLVQALRLVERESAARHCRAGLSKGTEQSSQPQTRDRCQGEGVCLPVSKAEDSEPAAQRSVLTYCHFRFCALAFETALNWDIVDLKFCL